MIRIVLLVAILALPLGVQAQGTTTERPERGTVTAADSEDGILEVNDVEYLVPPGVVDWGKIEVGNWVTIHFERQGDDKRVTDLITEDHID